MQASLITLVLGSVAERARGARFALSLTDGTSEAREACWDHACEQAGVLPCAVTRPDSRTLVGAVTTERALMTLAWACAWITDHDVAQEDALAARRAAVTPPPRTVVSLWVRLGSGDYVVETMYEVYHGLLTRSSLAWGLEFIGNDMVVSTANLVLTGDDIGRAREVLATLAPHAVLRVQDRSPEYVLWRTTAPSYLDFESTLAAPLDPEALPGTRRVLVDATRTLSQYGRYANHFCVPQGLHGEDLDPVMGYHAACAATEAPR